MQVTIYINDKLNDHIQAVADEQGRPLSNLIKKLIKDYLMKHNYTSSTKEQGK